MKRFSLGRSASIACLLGLLLTTTVHAGPLETKKYLRFVDNGSDHQLQTSIVHFTNAAGAKVDLVGAVHIADTAYFTSLNERFKSYDALLYEMVKPKGMVGVGQAEAAHEKRASSWVSYVQRFMKDQLDLDFQLDRIDYTAENFVHADFDAETFLARQEARGESMLTLMLDQLLHEMSKPQDQQAGGGEAGLMDLVAALQSPDRARQLKLVLGRQFESMDDALDAMGGPDGSVILTERNAHAMKVLKEELDAGKKNVAVFYGAAHLHGMEAILTKDMGFKQVGGPEWLVAWDLADKSARPAAKAIDPPTTKPVSAATSTSDARWGRDDQ